jgi:elongation factor P
MINAGELRPGNTIERAGELYTVVDFQHVKQGRGTAFVRAKFKSLTGGGVTEETFRPEEKFARARIDRNEAQFLYMDGDNYMVMDTTTFDQYPVSPDHLGDAVRYLKENDMVFLLQHEGRIIGAELPNSVELDIVETDPGYKGDTANAATKPAKLETGAMVDVPLFVNQGDRVKIDTRTGKYIERVTQ